MVVYLVSFHQVCGIVLVCPMQCLSEGERNPEKGAVRGHWSEATHHPFNGDKIIYVPFHCCQNFWDVHHPSSIWELCFLPSALCQIGVRRIAALRSRFVFQLAQHAYTRSH